MNKLAQGLCIVILASLAARMVLDFVAPLVAPALIGLGLLMLLGFTVKGAKRRGRW